MLKIRLRRMGSHHRPFYRVVVSDGRRAPTGSAVEELGYYNPLEKPSIISIDVDRIEYWRSRGAQLSPTVTKLLKRSARAANDAETPETGAAEEAPAAKAEKAPAKAEEAPAAKAEEAPAAEAEEPAAKAEEAPADAEEAEDSTPEGKEAASA